MARSLMVAPLIVAFALTAFAQSPTEVTVEGDCEGDSSVLVVRELHLVNVNSATAEEQEHIAASIAGLCFPSRQIDELKVRIEREFKRLGFYRVRSTVVALEAPDSSVTPPTISVVARIEEGDRFRLRAITFTGNRAVRQTSLLRSAFPIRDGDIFDVDKLSKGLENLRRVYLDLGYINCTSVPDARIDDKNRLITLNVDMDEGSPAYIKSFTVKGAESNQESGLRSLWPEMLKPGMVYNAGLVSRFFVDAQQLLPPGSAPEKNLEVIQNVQEHTVDLVLTLGSR